MKPIVKGMFARSLAGQRYGFFRPPGIRMAPVHPKSHTAFLYRGRPKKKKLIHVQPDFRDLLTLHSWKKKAESFL